MLLRITTLLDIQSSQIFLGTQNLLNDLSRILMILAPILGGLAVIYMGIRKMVADEAEGPVWKRRMFGVCLGLVLIFCASAIVNIFSGYYSG